MRLPGVCCDGSGQSAGGRLGSVFADEEERSSACAGVEATGKRAVVDRGRGGREWSLEVRRASFAARLQTGTWKLVGGHGAVGAQKYTPWRGARRQGLVRLLIGCGHMYRLRALPMPAALGSLRPPPGTSQWPRARSTNALVSPRGRARGVWARAQSVLGPGWRDRLQGSFRTCPAQRRGAAACQGDSATSRWPAGQAQGKRCWRSHTLCYAAKCKSLGARARPKGRHRAAG